MYNNIKEIFKKMSSNSSYFYFIFNKYRPRPKTNEIHNIDNKEINRNSNSYKRYKSISITKDINNNPVEQI